MACDGSKCACESGAEHDSGALADVGGRVLTIGTFDGLHLGHLRLFEFARKFGHLTVGVNSDDFVEEYKGHRPLDNEQARRDLVGSLRVVDTAVLSYGNGRSLITLDRPEWLIVGSDWHEWDYLDQVGMQQSELDAMGTKVVYFPRLPGLSSSSRR